MKLLEKILLMADFRASARNALKTVIHVARTFISKVTVMHALPENSYQEYSIKGFPEET